MKVLIVVTSPLQVQNAIQYITQHAISFSSCLLAHVGSSNEDDNARALTIAADHAWAGIEKFPPYRAFKPDKFEARDDWVAAEIANRQSFIDLLVTFFARMGTDFDLVLMGDYRPMSFRQFLQFTTDPQPEVVLLDDGAVSRYVMEFRESGVANEEATRGILPNLGEGDPFKVMESASLTFFTIYDEPVGQSDRLVANTRYQSMSSDSFTTLASEVWVCGVNHVEARLAKQDELFAMCRKVRAWFPDKRIIYFPHRRETSEKVDLICRMIGANASEYRFGIEEYVFQTRSQPEHLVVFGSTVADTLSRLFAPATRILVVVPKERYFTNAKRTDHVRNVIVDNVRKNRFVCAVGAEVESVSEWLSASTVVPALPGEARTIALGADAPLFTKLEGLTATTSDDGWMHIREVGGKGLHRATLGTFQASARGEAILHLFRLRTEERYAFRIRFLQADKTSNLVEVLTVLDSPASYLAKTAFGRLAVEVTVDWNRVAHVSVFAKAHKKVSSILQLITLDAPNARSSVHDGTSSAGFSMAALAPAASPVCVVPLGDPGHVAQVAAPTFGTALLSVVLGNSTAILCVHGGFLTGLSAERLVSLQFSGFRIGCIDGASKGGPAIDQTLPKQIFAPSSEPGTLRDRLHRTVPVHLSRSLLRGVVAMSSSGHRVSLGRGGEMLIGTSDLRTGKTVVPDIRKSDLLKVAGFTLLF